MSSAMSYSLRDEVDDFLFHEAECLDTRQFAEWFALIDEEIQYVVPVRHTPEARAGSGFSDVMGHLDEDYYTLKGRVARMSSPYAWAESPPSRFRHFISNVRQPRQTNQDKILPGQVIAVKSNLLIFRSNSDDSNINLISGERHDQLRRAADGQLKLLKRLVLLDQTTIGTHNISFLF